MKDYVGEKAALQQTQSIIKEIDSTQFSKQLYKDIVLKIYDNQLKKFTKYTRSQRRKAIKELTVKRSQSVRSPAPPHPDESKGLNQNPSDNMEEQGSQ